MAASHVVLREGDTQVLYSVVLHVANMRIAGIETLVQRVAPGGKFQPTELGKPVRGMNDPIPAGKRQSRDETIRIALTYPKGLRVGNFTDGGTPFSDNAYRVENGVITADQTDARRSIGDIEDSRVNGRSRYATGPCLLAVPAPQTRPGGREEDVVIRDDAAGAFYGLEEPDRSQNRPAHFNDSIGGHYDYGTAVPVSPIQLRRGDY